MARVTRTFHARGDLETWLVERGWTVEADGDDIVANQGSQLRMRALGGWFIGADKLPKRLVARPVDGGHDVTVEDTIGFGFADPKLKGRYKDAFAELEAELSS